jgi:hypothetical protein
LGIAAACTIWVHSFQARQVVDHHAHQRHGDPPLVHASFDFFLCGGACSCARRSEGNPFAAVSVDRAPADVVFVKLMLHFVALVGPSKCVH